MFCVYIQTEKSPLANVQKLNEAFKNDEQELNTLVTEQGDQITQRETNEYKNNTDIIPSNNDDNDVAIEADVDHHEEEHVAFKKVRIFVYISKFVCICFV